MYNYKITHLECCYEANNRGALVIYFLDLSKINTEKAILKT